MLKLFTTLATLAFAAQARPSLKKHLSSANDVIMPPRADNSTYGNTEEINTVHLDLNLTVDFNTTTLSGQAYH